ncbi:MAG: hypothetical protein JW741_11010 [Sedimentisphaerales bacterium]|nr:hypothetical protein [Sedimentisphaerales bacterium]
MTKRPKQQKKTGKQHRRPQPRTTTDKEEKADIAETSPGESQNKQEPPKPSGLCPSSLDRWTCRATVAIAVATILYTYSAIQQLGVLKTQLDQMKKASESDSLAWNRQLDVMDGQFSQMRQNASLENRAWVGVLDATHNPIEPNKPGEGIFVFKNTGKTPASIIFMGHTTCIAPPDLDVAALANDREKAAWATETPIVRCIAPNASIAWNFSTGKEPLDEETAASVNSGAMHLHVVGKIVYRDIFGVEHQTRFCGIAQTDTRKMSMHHQYNYMD